jgi:hypothetical protein
MIAITTAVSTGTREAGEKSERLKTLRFPAAPAVSWEVDRDT